MRIPGIIMHIFNIVTCLYILLVKKIYNGLLISNKNVYTYVSSVFITYHVYILGPELFKF